MREIRIYQAGSYSPGDLIDLSPEASHHVAVVLRMQVGDLLTLFCGDNREFSAQLEVSQKKMVTVRITTERVVSRESSIRVHLAQAISKGERMEFVMQKAVELGVSSISPLLTERSVVKLDKTRLDKKLAQWQAIAIAACEQCGRNQIPEVNSILSLSDYLHQIKAPLKLVLDPRDNKTWRDYCFETGEVALLIGPEGGFSQEELKQIYQAEFKPLCLGPRILRTETAAIAALSVLQALGGDL
jgi:16S rRNA (uracil1498-N3)-methyltransferase